MKNQLEEFREELNKKDNEIKSYHQTIVSLEEKLTEAENVRIYIIRRRNSKIQIIILYYDKKWILRGVPIKS